MRIFLRRSWPPGHAYLYVPSLRDLPLFDRSCFDLLIDASSCQPRHPHALTSLFGAVPPVAERLVCAVAESKLYPC